MSTPWTQDDTPNNSQVHIDTQFSSQEHVDTPFDSRDDITAEKSTSNSDRIPAGEDDYPQGIKFALLMLALCLSVFLLSLVSQAHFVGRLF